MKTLNTLSKNLSSPVILNYTLPILMIYLVAGTIAQKYIGLYEATKIFFSSIILWFGPLPLPGFPILIAIIFLNLTFKLIFKSPWKTQYIGNIVTHIGVLLLLLGGLLTALLSNEGYLDLAVGERKSAVSDYHIREFVILDENNEAIHTVIHKDLKEQDTLIVSDLGINIEILETCQNCKINQRQPVHEIYHGMAQHMALSNTTLHRDNENNMAGLTFHLSGTNHDGVYLTLEDVPKRPEIKINEKIYQFSVRKQKRKLPFKVELLNFKRDMHPGTSLAKEYESRIRITDGLSQWESLISMNEPLRYKGYTFFQSSFIETPNGDISVLTVVWNAGRAFPYISGIAMCLGLIVHLLVRKKGRVKNAA